MNKEQPVTLTLQELDNTLFAHLTKAMQEQFPNDHRNALKVAMRVADGAMAEFEALAKRQSKSGAAKVAAEARWSSPASLTADIAAPNVDGSVGVDATTSPKKRIRRTKAQIAADLAAVANVRIPMPPYTPPALPTPYSFTSDEQQAAAEFGAAPTPTTPYPPAAPNQPANMDAAIAAASGSPTNVPPPPPLQIPTFGTP